MKKAIALLAIGFAFAGTVGCASAPEKEIADAAPAVAAEEAPAELPRTEPIAEAAPAQAPAPVLAEPAVAQSSPSLGASSSGRGH